ncbi:cation:proton antiporter regulatory subunit [Halarchaeum sp. CBA1220]|uniref:cation:proton antiporter regulatory subunit n=1 Tax=Halarchaeum sp. CBA1220 TaxID=1853682 RepID=UPI000F3A9214|nr:TrkA C-terminal domain-containing protein [Halarchaeum sp. CBA1220]QLC33069.1 cation:proton antiporter regulatory subunit [Halarchaeum sp. CBA1220]
MSIFETDIPGVGRRFEMELTGGTRLVTVVHHDGRCELFRRDGEDADGEKILDLSGDQANKLGSILEGAYFESVDVDELTVPLGDAILEWVEVTPDSPLADEALTDTDIRAETGVSVIAVQRDDETIPNPGPDFVIRPGDLLVTVGTREEHAAFADHVEP